MTDPIENPVTDAPAPEASEASGDQPAAPAIDVDALRTQLRNELKSEFDSTMNDRVKDFQRMVSERDQQIQQLRLSGLPDEEREAAEIEQAEAHYAKLEAENWLLKQAQSNKPAAEFLQKLYEAEDSDTQFAIVAEFLNSAQAASASTPSPDPEVNVPDVDANNPAPTPSAEIGRLPDGTPFTEQSVESFLKALGNDSLAKIRGW